MRTILIAHFASLLIALTCSAAVAEELSADRLQKIAAIGYRGIDFSVTRHEFVKAFPTAVRRSDSEAEYGVIGYMLLDDSDNHTVGVSFFGDALMGITFVYDAERVARAGGADALFRRAEERFGLAHWHNGDAMVWNFPTIDRQIIAGLSDLNWSLTISRLSTRKHIQDRKD